MTDQATTTSGFDPAPSRDLGETVAVGIAPVRPGDATALGVLVGPGAGVPDGLGLDRAALTAAGFTGKVGETLVVPGAAGVVVAVGGGEPSDVNAEVLRDAAAAFARATRAHAALAFSMSGTDAIVSDTAAQAIVEGILLARYSYDSLRRDGKAAPVSALTLLAEGDVVALAETGAHRGAIFAAATSFARDLANTPHSHLTASRLADLATALGPSRRLEVEVFDKDALIAMGCGGLLGVNSGSAEPPRMIKLTYRPPGDSHGRLALVGKGIMCDSGGLALTPGDEVHAQMKNDMSGAAAVLASMSSLAALGCSTTVTGFLMCTDNMPSGTAMALGDVITMRGGTTVEVINTDAEGRLVMADALVLATEEPNDAIVDIATLTGACMRALGTRIAGVMGSDDGLVEQVRTAGAATDEPVWPLPLEPRYRAELNSTVADLRNLGGVNAGAITAGLFLAEFVGDVPWAHLDIAGTAQTAADGGWHTAGCSGFGARLLLELALRFVPPARPS